MTNKADQTNTGELLAKAYEFADVERRWYEEWQKQKQFRATMDASRPSFSIVIPPPNVTGVLHVGHALNNTMQDVLVRYKRMSGYNTLWVPGMDHAGIATQNVVERQLAAEDLTRHDVGRDKFIERVWQWKAQSGGQIINQLKRLGCSCDWERERFTMDEGLSRAVRAVFTRLYNEGLIYKGDYIINWCPRCHTALADLEVEHEPTDGKLYRIRYPYAQGDGYIVVATTRPETMLGDTGVAVHPDDERYTSLPEKSVILPLVNRKIPVVFDPQVEREFGTGALKVTPAHDLNDFEIARRHDLPSIKVMDDNGCMNVEAGPYAGLDRFACRTKIVEDLREQGYLEGIEDYQHGVGHCYRCATVVEPSLSKQWFVSVKPLAAKAIDAVKNGDTKIHPKSWENTYFDWMYNIRDWCISRQIWWGHQIPAWTCEACGELIVSENDPDHCPKCQSGQLLQETDVLDTWFSSALWPFSTLGWPDDTAELKFFYPTSVLITSFDILFFWVSRMMMMGIHFMDKVPFKDVYLHALVRDAQGQKMSKSKGNVMDPLLVMDKYGTDALRFTMTAFAAQGRDIRLSEERIEGYRYFINKIWNASRFALMHISECDPSVTSGISGKGLGLPHRWILSRLNRTIAEVHRSLNDYRFNDAASAMYQFVWHEFCDWYLELIKPELFSDSVEKKHKAQAVLFTVLESVIKLLHPVIPFVTEEIWHVLPGVRKSIMTEPYPLENTDWDDPEAESTAQLVMGLIGGIRNIRSEMQIHPSAQIEAIVICQNQLKKNTIEEHGDEIKGLTRTNTLTVRGEGHGPKGAASYIFEDIEICVPLEGLIDVQKELDKLSKEQAKIDKQLAQSQGKLSNKKFLDNAPEDVVAKEKDKVETLSATLAKIEQTRKRLQEIGS
ncbi:MAG: valine--tRNA ligase [Proteobacteria bacterium]|nr:valine--tRNA ligase [Pseudomonadota bacterium]MBU4298220.1 valine--tRNA ligase [Pseudomonadota bacterium]MCG2747488.1 valine--tRNA ligase [Desulfobulbaceae bacterium]